MLLDYHMHSDFSEDCFTPMERTIEAAIQKGVTEICFTEHLDYDYPDPDFTFDLDVVTYKEKIEAMQTKYAKKITIKKENKVRLILTRNRIYIRNGCHKKKRKDRSDANEICEANND